MSSPEVNLDPYLLVSLLGVLIERAGGTIHIPKSEALGLDGISVAVQSVEGGVMLSTIRPEDLANFVCPPKHTLN